jgi:hypothetical protein
MNSVPNVRRPNLLQSALVALASARHCAVVVLAPCFAACPTAIDANDYDRSCEFNDDCVVVADGEKCNLDRCGCGGAAINARALEDFQADRDGLVCPDPLNDLGPVCVCRDVFAVCEVGSCTTTTTDPTAD